MTTPFDIVKILTAAAPIVASITSMSNKSETNNKPSTEVTINNNFYVNSEKDATKIANTINDQLLESIKSSGTRYMI